MNNEWTILSISEKQQALLIIIFLIGMLFIFSVLILLYIKGINKISKKIGEKHNKLINEKKGEFIDKNKKKTLKQSFNVNLKPSKEVIR